MQNMKFSVWRMNKLSPFEQSQALVAYFNDIELAKDFCDYQATLGECYAVFNRDNMQSVYNPSSDI